MSAIEKDNSPTEPGWSPLDPITTMGSSIYNAIQGLGDFGRFLGSILHWCFRGPTRMGWRDMMTQMYEMGTRSIPVVMLTGAFIGAVLAIEAYPQFQALGFASRLGSVVVVSVVKQIGPVLTAVMLAGRVGGAMTAELGTMKVTEQVDALRAMAADPIRTLAVPRFLACVLMTPVLTVFSDIIGAIGGWLIAVKVEGVNNYHFWHYASQATDLFTINTGLIKSFFFGVAIASIACYKGFRSGSGAQGVGRACTESFVASFVVILVMNFFLATMLNNIYNIYWPSQAPLF